ncbi:MAG: hypothetical protein JXB50_05320, partial [Spirochaetes bacterium]|nr:hypothetical protein [Spirochaetota bacterium]
MSIYFSSEIYNNFKKKIANNQPTFSILNEIENFSIKEAIDFANNTPNFKNIFIIFSGQQSFHNLATADFDLLFGLRLTGADRLSKKWNNGLFWNGKYKIYKSTPGEPGSIDKTSLASALYDKFRSNSLIIDVVNCKFDWHRLYNNNQKSLENFYSTLFNDLFKKITNLNNINLFFFGFSRG